MMWSLSFYIYYFKKIYAHNEVGYTPCSTKRSTLAFTSGASSLYVTPNH